MHFIKKIKRSVFKIIVKININRIEKYYKIDGINNQNGLTRYMSLPIDLTDELNSYMENKNKKEENFDEKVELLEGMGDEEFYKWIMEFEYKYK